VGAGGSADSKSEGYVILGSEQRSAVLLAPQISAPNLISHTVLMAIDIMSGVLDEALEWVVKKM
jgi:hypothetical protein